MAFLTKLMWLASYWQPYMRNINLYTHKSTETDYLGNMTTAEGSNSAGSVPPTPVDITIRFALDLPDLRISISDALNTNVSYIKQQIRALRPGDTGRRRLRLIYAGRVLLDHGKSLGEQVRIPIPRGLSKDIKGKKKMTDQDEETGREEIEVAKLYIHCAVGEEISEEEIRKEEQTDVSISGPISLSAGYAACSWEFYN